MLSTQMIILNYPVILSHRRGITVSLETYLLDPLFLLLYYRAAEEMAKLQKESVQ